MSEVVPTQQPLTQPSLHWNYLGFPICSEIEVLSQIFLNIPPLDTTTLNLIFKLIFKYLRGIELQPEQWSSFLASSTIDKGTFKLVYIGTLSLIETLLSYGIAQEFFTNHIIHALHLPSEYAHTLIEVTQQWRAYSIGNKSLPIAIRKPSLYQIKWRIDAVISTSTDLIDFFKPSTIIQLTDTSGRTRTFGLDIKLLTYLRMQVAVLLEEFKHLEHQHLLKIDKN